MPLADSTEKDDEQVSEKDDEQVSEQEDQQADQPPASETDEPAAGETPETSEAPSGGDESVVVTIGDAPPASEEGEEQDDASAPQWVKSLRVQQKEQAKRIRELEAENAKLKGPGKPEPDDEAIGAEPTLEGCDYDADKFKAEVLAWNSRKSKAEAKAAEREKAAENERQAWQAKLDGYTAKKATLKVADFDDAEEQAKTTFSVTQQGILLQGAENPAVLVYALGKNPDKAKELAAISDPVAFAFAAAKLEAQLKVTPKKALPTPERKLKGNAAVVGQDAELARLEAEADRTGDRSKVVAYKRKQKGAAGK